METLDTDFTQDDKCAFSSTLITEHFCCANASNVVRRGGSEISCCDQAASKKCQLVYGELKKIAAPAFDTNDDLLNMPHGVMVKIQHGGLLGLNHLNDNSDNSISDISKLISDSEIKFKVLEDIPYESTIDYITGYKVRNRRK